MAELVVIVNAVNAYKSGSYNAPSSYYIPADIPVKSLFPARPENIIPWYLPPQRLTSMSGPVGKKGSSRNSSPHKTTRASGNSSRDLSIESLTLETSTSQQSHNTRRNTRSPSKAPTQSRSVAFAHSSQSPQTAIGRAAESLDDVVSITRPMRRYLKTYFGLSNQRIEALSRTIQSPQTQFKSYQALLEVGLSTEEADFFIDWIFNSFNSTDEDDDLD
jgi:hypothetical protein